GSAPSADGSFHHASFGAIADANQMGAITTSPPNSARRQRPGRDGASDNAAQRTDSANAQTIIAASNVDQKKIVPGLGISITDGATRTTCSSGKPASNSKPAPKISLPRPNHVK